MSPAYDVVVGGGSVAGLSFAAEAASRGLRVIVLEEDLEVGEPEKCDGLVSMRAMNEYIPPRFPSIQSRVSRGTVYVPSGASASVDASKLEVIVVDRSAYERQLAGTAESKGASVLTSTKVMATETTGETVRVKAGSLDVECSYYVDATGPSAIVRKNRKGLIPAAKYEVSGDWFRDGEVEVHLDRQKYPGFFAWVIPRGEGIAKVGVAGYGINSYRTLETFLADRKCEILRKVAAPIYIGGPVPEFVSGRTVFVGESAGQVKPTTAGGILASVAAGMSAGRWVAEAIQKKDPKLLKNYQRDWEGKFGDEFRTMKRLRHAFESLSNDDFEQIVSVLSSKKVSGRLASTDFDFHASAMLSALGVKGTLQLAGLLFSAEARQTLSSLAQGPKA